MKRILLAAIILFVAGITVHAQQTASQGGATRPTSSQIKQNAQQLTTQSKTNSSQFESTQADLNARNTSNSDAATFARLTREIERLETLISEEQTKIRTSLDNGSRLAPELFSRVQRLIDQHKAKIAELDAFIAG